MNLWNQSGQLDSISVFPYLIDIEKMSFEELCCKYPKVAIEKISDDYKIYCEKSPQIGKCLNSGIDLRQPGKRESPNSRGISQKKDGQQRMTMSLFSPTKPKKGIMKIRCNYKWRRMRMKSLIPTFLPSYHSGVLNNADLPSAKIPGVRDL